MFLIDFLALVPQPLIEVVQARGATTVSKQPASFGEGRRARTAIDHSRAGRTSCEALCYPS